MIQEAVILSECTCLFTIFNFNRQKAKTGDGSSRVANTKWGGEAPGVVIGDFVWIPLANKFLLKLATLVLADSTQSSWVLHIDTHL